MGEVINMPAKEMFLPTGTTQAGTGPSKFFGVIAGVSGVGKSHLIRQLCASPDYGPNEVLVLMAEDSTATYGDPQPHRIRCKTVSTVESRVKELIQNGSRRLPKIVVLDSLSGVVDYQLKLYNETQPFRTEKDNRDVRAEYGDLGKQIGSLALLCRDEMPTDILWLVTSYETPGQPTEYAVAGNVIPKNLTRWTSFTLYMRAVSGELPRAEVESKGDAAKAEHRTIGFEGEKALVINRFLFSQNTGEIQAKGHRNLNVIEKAYLPDVLRKIKGESA